MNGLIRRKGSEAERSASFVKPFMKRAGELLLLIVILTGVCVIFGYWG